MPEALVDSSDQAVGTGSEWKKQKLSTKVVKILSDSEPAEPANDIHQDRV